MELKKGYCSTCRHMSEEETMKREYAFLTRVGFSYCSLVDGWKSDIDSRPCKCWESQVTEEEVAEKANKLGLDFTRRGIRCKYAVEACYTCYFCKGFDKDLNAYCRKGHGTICNFAKNDAPCFDHLIDDEKYDTTSDVIKRLTEEVKPF